MLTERNKIMIDINELRLGNLVQYTVKSYCATK